MCSIHIEQKQEYFINTAGDILLTTCISIVYTTWLIRYIYKDFENEMVLLFIYYYYGIRRCSRY